MSPLKDLNRLLSIFLSLCMLFMVSCGDDDDDDNDDAPDNSKTITNIVLTFTPPGGGREVTYEAVDEQGLNPVGPASIRLSPSTTYTLTMIITNNLGSPNNVAGLIEDEAEDHRFYYQWTEDFFDQPTGDGNFDDPTDPVNYLDLDDNELPLGLITNWTTGVRGSGTFRLALQHQPGMKSASSTVDDGVNDIDISFAVEIGN